MMKNKIIECEYNGDTGVSTVTIQNKFGRFTGKACLNPEDENVESQFLGENIAELRARVKCYRKRASLARHDADVLLHFANNMLGTRNFDQGAYYYNVLYKHIHKYLSDADELTLLADSCEHQLGEYIKNQQMNIHKMREKKNNEETQHN